MTDLSTAVSPDTAHIVPDYPYGFRLRCTMRIWVEYRKGKGFRIGSQTSNPKKPGTVWNKPKLSTYHKVCAGLRIDPDTGHVIPGGLSEYSDLAEYEDFRVKFPELTKDARDSLDYFTFVKRAYKQACADAGVENIYTATTEKKMEVQRAIFRATAAAREQVGRNFP